MKNHFFLWPEARFFRGGYKTLKLVKTCEVETYLESLFYTSNAKPVLVSSARVGIVLSLMHAGLSRSAIVKLFPYASHCVIDAVGRVAMPSLVTEKKSIDMQLIYHQWGYINCSDIQTNNIIEDAVDSYCKPGVKLFPLDGNYEIWSLPKLIGSLGGGVIWCKDGDCAKQLKKIRDGISNATNLRWFIKLFSSILPSLRLYWDSVESLGSRTPVWANGDILYGLQNWNILYEQRLERVKLLKPFLIDELDIPVKRLPSVIPVSINNEQKEYLQKIGINTGFRHVYVKSEDGELIRKKVLPVPVHQDVPLNILEKTIRIL